MIQFNVNQLPVSIRNMSAVDFIRFALIGYQVQESITPGVSFFHEGNVGTTTPRRRGRPRKRIASSSNVTEKLLGWLKPATGGISVRELKKLAGVRSPASWRPFSVVLQQLKTDGALKTEGMGGGLRYYPTALLTSVNSTHGGRRATA